MVKEVWSGKVSSEISVATCRIWVLVAAPVVWSKFDAARAQIQFFLVRSPIDANAKLSLVRL